MQSDLKRALSALLFFLGISSALWLVAHWMHVPTASATVQNEIEHASIALIPLDDRPASVEFAPMIAKIADEQIMMPPHSSLGYFTKPGSIDQMKKWLLESDLSHIETLIVSADMLAYGGLIASREPMVTKEVAKSRLDILREVHAKYPKLKIYLFSSVMRVALTSEKRTRTYRNELSLYVQNVERASETKEKIYQMKAINLRKKLSKSQIDKYYSTRIRNLDVNLYTIQLSKEGVIDYLLLCQDDAQPYGPHHRDQKLLFEAIDQSKVGSKALLMEGIDEAPNVLLSRALLDRYHFKPKVAVFYTSEAGENMPGPFENRPVNKTVEFHLLASGAELEPDYHKADYYLYVNTPKRSNDDLAAFEMSLVDSVHKGKPVAISDLNFSEYSGGGDSKLIHSLLDRGVGGDVIAYAGWNTPGNSLGTTIPQANIYLLARKSLYDTSDRIGRCEQAEREFLLHRFVMDYGYHTIIRPKAYKYIQSKLKQPVDEMDAGSQLKASQYVRNQMGFMVKTFSNAMFINHPHSLSSLNDTFTFDIQSVRASEIYLPWPRAYEVKMKLIMNSSLIHTAAH